MTPRLDVFLLRDGASWRLLFAGGSWRPERLRQRMNEAREVPVKEPDLADLERHQWACDAPYTVQPTTCGGGVALLARGRSAIVLAEWLDGLL